MYISNMTLNIYYDLKIIFLYYNMFKIPYLTNKYISKGWIAAKQEYIEVYLHENFKN